MRPALKAKPGNFSKHREPLRQENSAVLQHYCTDERVLAFFSEFSFDKEVTIGKFTFCEANCLISAWPKLNAP